MQQNLPLTQKLSLNITLAIIKLLMKDNHAVLIGYDTDDKTTTGQETKNPLTRSTL